MIVGRLFVALGIKGGKRAKSEVDGVAGSLKNTASMGLEAKAAIVGAVYALERLFSKSGQAGTDLTNFNASLGISTQMLQQYQYAARQAGVSNEAVEGSFRSLQNVVTNAKLGKGAPEGLAHLARTLSNAGVNFSIDDFWGSDRDPSKLLQALQAYAQIEEHAGLRNKVFKDFGLGDDMAAALTRNAFTPEVMAKAPTYSDREIAQLDKANIAWSNLGHNIQMSIGRLNAQFGGQLVQDISKVADQILRMTTSLMKLADKIDLFKGIGSVFEGWGHIFSGISLVIDKIKGAAENPEEAKADFQSFKDDNRQLVDHAKSEVRSFWRGTIEAAKGLGITLGEGAVNLYRGVKNDGVGALAFPGVTAAGSQAVPSGASVAPPAAAPATPGGPVSTEINFNQSINFNNTDAQNAQQTSDSIRRATQQALRQMPGIAQGS